VAEPLVRVELTASFLERLAAIETFLAETDAGFACDKLLELRTTVIPTCAASRASADAISIAAAVGAKRWPSWPRVATCPRSFEPRRAGRPAALPKVVDADRSPTELVAVLQTL
jgi:hypothetical protein